MGRPAHSSTGTCLTIIGASVPADLPDLVLRIRALLEASEGTGVPRKDVEPTLTEGYARALELDAECLRFEHRIDRMTHALAEGREVPAGKLSALLNRLHEAEQQAEDLRALLAPLRKLVAKAA
jgi:hypothetical protein